MLAHRMTVLSPLFGPGAIAGYKVLLALSPLLPRPNKPKACGASYKAYAISKVFGAAFFKKRQSPQTSQRPE